MIDLKSLIEEKERLVSILSGEVVITPKYFGNTIIAEYSRENHTYYKKKKDKITIIDTLTSDLYSKPIDYLKSVEDCFKSGTYYFTNNYKSGKIILNERDYYKPNSFPQDDIFMVCEKLFDGKLDDEYIGMFKKGYVNKILKRLGVTNDMTTIFIRSKENHKNVFKINTKYQPKSYIPSDIYNLVLIDMIRSIDIDSLGKIMIESDEEEQVYMAITSKIFLSYLNKTKYDLDYIDFGYPKYMKVRAKEKMLWLPVDVVSVISENPGLYDCYMVILMAFRKKILKSNDHMNSKIEEKYSKIYSTINDLCKNAAMNVSIPSYYEHLENK